MKLFSASTLTAATVASAAFWTLDADRELAAASEPELAPRATEDPHGMLLTTRVNEVALAAIEQGADAMPEGAIVVKRNYIPDGTLAAVTTMYKRNGYNPDHSDWFFAKHLPDGSLDQADMDGTKVPMEGRVPGYQNCHGQQSGNDYLFTATLGVD